MQTHLEEASLLRAMERKLDAKINATVMKTRGNNRGQVTDSAEVLKILEEKLYIVQRRVNLDKNLAEALTQLFETS